MLSSFGMIGLETIAVSACENKDLRTEETIKIATRKLSLRIITLYALATFTVGLNVPYTYPMIQDQAIISFGFGENSVFVVSTVLNRLTGWPYFVNDFIIFSATTAGANGIYNASRTLHALASIPEVWPSWGWMQSFRRRLEKTNYGVPQMAVFISTMFSLLGFLAASSQSQKVRFFIKKQPFALSSALPDNTLSRPRIWGRGHRRDADRRHATQILGRMVRACTMFMIMTYALVSASYLVFFRWFVSQSLGVFGKNQESSHMTHFS